VLYSILYRHTETSEWPKMTKYKNTSICALRWSLTKIILRFTVSKTSKQHQTFPCFEIIYLLTDVHNDKLYFYTTRFAVSWGKGGGVGWPLMSKNNYEVFFFRNIWIAIMIPVALEKDHRLEGEVGLSVERTDSLIAQTSALKDFPKLRIPLTPRGQLSCEK